MLRGLLTGELRQGALEGLMIEAVAAASRVPATAVRRATMLAGDLQRVAVVALAGGEKALAEALASAVPVALLVPRIVTRDRVEAGQFFARTLAAGHEGVVVEDLESR